MAGEKTTEKQELNLDEKVTVKNIAGWPVTFQRWDGLGDITITAEGGMRLPRNEIISQVQNGNRLFTGVDGIGGHATLFIDDAPTRVEVGFDSEDGKVMQTVYRDAVVVELFKAKNLNAFESEMKDIIRTRAEKYAVIQTIKKLKINDYSKIRIVEDYTGFKVQ